MMCALLLPLHISATLRFRMDIIVDELKRNNVNITKETLDYDINTILREGSQLYDRINVLDFEQLYHEVNPTNFGRIIAYLA